MAHSNAAELAKAVPECVSGCFNIGVAATGCGEDDFDCWCYDKNHETIVDTMSECLGNRERKLKESCSKDEMFQMENSYWKICEQYWETYGTATEPTTKSTSVPKSSLTSSRVSSITSTAELPQDTTKQSESENSDTSRDADAASTKTRGLSIGAQAGIGIGITLGAILIAVAISLWLGERKRRQKLQDELQNAKKRKFSDDGFLIYEREGVYEMEGDLQHCAELRGCMRTPELPAPTWRRRGEDQTHLLKALHGRSRWQFVRVRDPRKGHAPCHGFAERPEGISM
ncbi:uncharacterized protein NECHADRAFT_90788 [Fusarium vanettenii 77-13-4]|uniref:CFEM domain-containing protein n=1 Tax=Fusarium vanettenii (strain ATCC MYA-4622 / CBS 123669 / FGSC 9596 / NRRL 45880 / 77-13-4) TaxID=660122 RepID=C7Z6N6_FUSV7|nr:uncharacterized protein NECHADRAFT_90788 [Fusarium vanettenii 77-13-4]EEU40723.1 hypothetical protein NECHADRAFT_90788 [Fusarium vanettenii 77-13-4]